MNNLLNNKHIDIDLAVDHTETSGSSKTEDT